ncbi:MAG: PVC-type heme-binding CxxCH protein [Verrucomicrobiota bacterium]
MKLKLTFALVLLAFLAESACAQTDQPLRVFIRAGQKTHGPGQHDHPRFLAEYVPLLNSRGLQADGALTFPTAAQLEKTDVVVIYAADGMKIVGDDRANFEKFLQRGGGLVVIHDGVVSGDQHEWAKKVQGGAWIWQDRRTKWHEGEVGIYFVDTEHPITRGISNFDWKDEIYYELDMDKSARVLATSFHSVFVIAPQLWTFEKTWEGGTQPYRAFVSLPGHEWTSFETPHYRALLLRGIAWAGKRSNVDQFCKPEELASLKYPPGGPTAPEKAAAKLNLHPEFAINLVASEPLVEKVISLDWDPQGRLWVAETPEYPGGRTINKNDTPIFPQRPPGTGQDDRPPRDRISWLEDTNGDGLMDRKQVFYDGLELVTSLVFYKDGVIVSQAPDILRLRDTNGDGKADKVEKLFTGFGTFDTHAVLNNMRWGMDGWIYSAIGYSAGNPRSVDGSNDFGRVTAGVIRFKPDGSALEQVASGSCNTWGFDFAADGEMFYTTATCGEHFLHIAMPEKILARGSVGGVRASAVIPDHQRVFPAVKHTRPAYVQIDWVGQFTAAAGSCIYVGGAWPDKFDGAHFLQEPTVSLVHLDLLRPNGPTYVAHKESGQEQTEFIAGTDLWFRPVHSRVGPDGALYVVDFYNQAAIHNDTRGPAHGARNAATRPDRDHHFARIWRVQHKQAKKLPGYELDRAKPAALVKALEHPNGWVRMSAHRLLQEQPIDGFAGDLEKLLRSRESALARVHALWLLHQAGRLSEPLQLAALRDSNLTLRKNALRAIAESNAPFGSETEKQLVQALTEENSRARLQAIIALQSAPTNPEVIKALVDLYPSLTDPWSQSAVLGVTARVPNHFLEAIFDANKPEALKSLAVQVTKQIAGKQNAALAAQAVLLSGHKSGDVLKQAVLETLVSGLKPEVTPEWSSDLAAAFRRFLGSTNQGLPVVTLPLIARWDKGGVLKPDVANLVQKQTERLQDPNLSEEERGVLATSLLGVRNLNPEILPAVIKILSTDASVDLKRRILQGLGSIPDAALGEELARAFLNLNRDLQDFAFGQIIKRSDASLALLALVKDGKLALNQLGPANVHRLRTHPDADVSRQALAIIEAIRGPEAKEKETLLAQLLPVVRQSGHLENGRKLFTQNCANCHKFNGEGSNLAPDLTGMGTHGPEDLLVHIVDPNRLVEPNFISVSIETKDDQSFDGIVARENRSTVLLRNASGEFEIKTDNVRSRRSTGLSLMPGGFESLGAEALRDIIGYLCSGESKYRVLDLKPAFTANSTRGIYNSLEATGETLHFIRYGIVRAGDVPFEILSPNKTLNGNNLIVLKGGPNGAYSKTLPQRVNVKVGVAANKLHFLGGVAGWGYPWGGESKNQNTPVIKVTVHYADRQTEEIVLKNGVEFADYIGKFDVPGSRELPDIVRFGQVRWFTKPLARSAVIDSLSLESYDNAIAPTLVAITAELAGDVTSAAGHESTASIAGGGGADAGQASAASGTIRALIVGGGTHHDFQRWFNQEDIATLQAGGKAAVSYTENPATILETLPKIDVLYLSNNNPIPDPKTRQAIFDFTKSGKGLLLVHPALWYNWNDWPEYNRILIGGGSRRHDKYGEFEVIVDEPNHPIMAGVPKTFRITDELYHFEKDANGTANQVLATGRNLETGKTYPVVWITQLPNTRIVCITLGHDGKAHELPAFKTLLQNSLKWAAGK